MNSQSQFTNTLPLISEVTSAFNGVRSIVTTCSALDDVKTVICGHSHAGALCMGIVEPGKGIEQSHIEECGFAGLFGGQPDDVYWTQVVELGERRNVAIVWNGNQHNADFLLQPEPPFDLIPRGYVPVSVLPGARIEPEAMLREHFRPTFSELDVVLKRLGQRARRRVFVTGTPAPLEDAAMVKERLAREPFFAARASSLGIDIGTVPIRAAAVRRKLWFVIQEMLAESAARWGAQFVPTPQESLNANGFLDTLFSSGDITHANGRYGRLMLGKLAEYL